MKEQPKWAASRGDLGRLLKVSERTLARLEAEGVIAPARRGRGGRASAYDLGHVVPAYVAHLENRPSGVDEREARARRDRAAAELTELRIAERREELLPRDQVIAEGQAYTKAWAAMVRRLPRHLAQLGLASHEQQQAVESFCRGLLDEVSRWRTSADAERTIVRSIVEG